MPISIRTEPLTEVEREELLRQIEAQRPRPLWKSSSGWIIVVTSLVLTGFAATRVGVGRAVLGLLLFGVLASIALAMVLMRWWSDRTFAASRVVEMEGRQRGQAVLIATIDADRAVYAPCFDDDLDAVLLRVSAESYIALDASMVVQVLTEEEICVPARFRLRAFPAPEYLFKINDETITAAADGGELRAEEELSDGCSDAILRFLMDWDVARGAIPMIPAEMVQTQMRTG